jgi:Fe-S cluster assembly protein SufD
MAPVAERQDSLDGAFEAVRRDAPLGVGALGQMREAAFARFTAAGFPTTRDEEWRFTNLAPVAALTYERAANVSVAPDATAALVNVTGAAVCLTVVNGRLVGDPPATLPAGLAIRSLRTTRAEDLSPSRPSGGTILADLNTALFEDIVVVEIAPKAIIEGPVVIISVVVPGPKPTVVAPRMLVRVGEAAQASLVEVHGEIGEGAPVFVAPAVDVTVEAAGILDHVKYQCQGTASFHVANAFVRIGRAGTFTSHAVTVGGRIARNDIVSTLDGEGAECTLNGLYVAGGESLVDTHTTIDHAKAHCPSHEVYKGILTGRARAVFNGKIIVRQDAQKTDAKQTNKALLLTDDAQINTKPQLEILADDVKCTHGATVGQLDDDAMFYLQARGIGTEQARNMLVHAFAGDVLNGIRSEDVRHAAMARVDAILNLPPE